MSSQENQKNDNNPSLTPELAFIWVKYAKNDSNERVYNQTKTTPRPLKPKEAKDVSDKVKKDISLTREKFKHQPVKERLFLWYKAIFTKKEMTVDEFTKVIEMNDVMETEEFLFRHAPLRYSYIWRGKNLKFDEETIQKLEEELKKP